jgi:hypothetical protein
MSDYKDDPTFIILGQEVTIISDDLDWGTNTVANIGDKFHYMGEEQASLSTAIFAFQEMNNWELTPEEIRQVMLENDAIKPGETNGN